MALSDEFLDDLAAAPILNLPFPRMFRLNERAKY